MEILEGLLEEFFLDSKERLTHLEEMLIDLSDAGEEERNGLLETIKRDWHTLKGNAGMMGLKELQSLAHKAEDRIGDVSEEMIKIQLELVDLFRKGVEKLTTGKNETGKSADKAKLDENREEEAKISSVRVSFHLLDELVDLLAEMVIFKNRLSDTINRGQWEKNEASWDEIGASYESLNKTLDFIHQRVMQLRMVPLSSLFSNLRRIVYDESRREGKEIDFQTRGGDTPMDKALLDVASEALGHLVRNAVVHGIETSGNRKTSGKNDKGSVQIIAEVRSSEVLIKVVDDGRGIDAEALIEAAAEKGLDYRSGEDPYSLLFIAGVSTKMSVDMSSGRGVGLSAAQEAVQKVGGRIEVMSEIGRGTCFTVHLPLSVSISSALLVKADDEQYALPLISIIESLKFKKGDGHEINHSGVMSWRDFIVPLLDLGVIFDTSSRRRECGHVVIFSADGKTRGIICDELVGIREIVVKTLDKSTGGAQGIAGATILGDGRVVLILDPQQLVCIKPGSEYSEQENDSITACQRKEEK